MLEFEPDFERRSCFVDKGQAELKNRRCPQNPHVRSTEESVPGTSSATVSTQRDPGNDVDTGAAGAEKGRSLRTKGTPVLPSPASKGDFRRSGRSKSRGRRHLCACAHRRACPGNTVARWLEKAAGVCRGFNQRRTTGFGVEELQADEIRSFAGGKTRLTWIFVAIEVWSRLWPSTVVGRRSYRNTLALLRDVANRMDWERLP